MLDCDDKPTPATGKVITANRLRDGRVVWLGVEGHWMESIGEAVVYFGDEEALAKARAVADDSAKRQVVVAPYEVEIECKPGGPDPIRYREQIRAIGPSVGTDFGERKDALHHHVVRVSGQRLLHDT